MKRKITGIFLCLLMSLAFLLTGCDLFPKNYEAYLNKSVCTITYADETKEEITTEAFINAYNSYGSSLVQQGTSYEDAAEQTVDILINRYVLLNYAKTKITLTDEDYRSIYDEVYSSLVSNLDSYEEEVRDDWSMEAPSSPEDEEEDDVVVYTPYEPTAKVVFENGEYKIMLLDTDDEPTTNFSSIEQIIQEFNSYANPNDGTNNSKIKKEAYRRLISTLKKNEEGLKLSTDSASVLKRYVEKLTKSVEENYYITNLEEYYKTEDGYSTITVRQVLNKYKTLMLQSKFKYESNNETYDTAMLESFKDVYYVVDDNYFFVSHILMEFSDEQKNEYDNLQSEYEKGYISQGVYQQRLVELVAQIKAQVRDDNGNIIENTNVKASDVLTSLQKELASANTDEKKAEIFNKYMYKYSQDPGTLNAEYMYVIGNETSQMVESFTDASRELNEEGVFGNISGLVASEYGVHIVFYGGKVENLFTIDDMNTFELKDEDIEKLTNTKLSALNNKTVFDKVFELLSDDSYSVFENMNLNVLKKDLTIEKHKSVYENL